MSREEIDMQVALDNVLSEFSEHGTIENVNHIEFIRDAYKKVSGSMMRNYAREIGCAAFVDAVNQVCH